MVAADKIHVFDSKTVAFPQGIMTIKAAELADAGQEATEIIAALEAMRTTAYISATVKTLENLKKGGRLSNASAVIGSMLQVKPIIAMSPEGKLEAVGKVRTFKKAIANLVEQAKDANLDDSYKIAVIHVINPEEGSALKEEIAALYPNNEVELLPLSLTVSAHVGEGTLAIAWIKA